MKEFIGGFITGILLKNHVIGLLQDTANLLYTIKDKLNTKKNNTNYPITHMYFICKITNQKLFNDFFPGNKIQPNWKYYSEKQSIKIELDESLVKYLNKTTFDLSFKELFELKENNERLITLYLPFFQDIGENYIYIDYLVDKQKFTNVYSVEQTLKYTDFLLKETKLKEKYSNFVCGTIKYKKSENTQSEYISSYFRSFLNNEGSLTPELLLLHYNKLNIAEYNISILNNKKLEIYSKDMKLI